MPLEVTTVADDLAMLHVDGMAHRFEGLEPATTYDLLGTEVRTLPRPPGALLCRFASVNDVHFGETECGRIDDHPMGPILRAPDGAPPYPVTMNAAAVGEMAAIDPAAVVVKGDLTADGRPEEFEAYLAMYGGAFGERLHTVRGNHDAYRGQDRFAGDQVVDLPGVRIALLDTTIPFETTGAITAEQIDWLDTVAAEADRPVLVMGHHPNWVPTSEHRDPGYFGINPDDSEALIDVVARRRRIVGYVAGHTHRNRVRTVPASGAVPYVEVGCVKDFPGSWAEYRVHEGGILQVHHRISAPDALAWSEQCRHLYRDFGIDYVAYALAGLTDRCFPIPLRS